MKAKCSFCGNYVSGTAFRSGCVCDECLNFIKSMDRMKTKKMQSEMSDFFSVYSIDTPDIQKLPDDGIESGK